MDINAYANERLIEFCDAAHRELTHHLEAHFGQQWMDQGVRRHFPADYFKRVQSMLNHPMRVIDMKRTPDELFGVEHLWNIVNGNWSTVFRPVFQDKTRTQVYLAEITELRHNLAHRRGHHCLLRSDLIRILGGCRIILSALDAPQADRFADAVDTLSSGGSPWGPSLAGHLPPSDEMYTEFVGRRHALDKLGHWINSDRPQILVWGYGGAGKSALAYRFAREIRDSSGADLLAVCWVSAKRMEFSGGSVRSRSADFTDLPTFLSALWVSLYGSDARCSDLTPHAVIAELSAVPTLLIVDDFDTVSEDVPLTEFLLYTLRSTPTRLIYTSRHRVPTLENMEVPRFEEEELKQFIVQRASDYSVDVTECVRRISSIESVTGGYPLFVDDLIRHASFVGIKDALRTWSQKKGDAAREYALRRQIQYLSHSSGEVLIALSIANRALSIPDIAAVSGLTEDDAESGIRELLKWTIVNKVHQEESDRPAYRMNRNTGRLVQKTFKDDTRIATFAAALKALMGERVPEAQKAAIGRVIWRTKELWRTQSFEAAEKNLRDGMTGELSNSPDLFGVLGWLYSKQEPLEKYSEEARGAFTRSHQLGSRRVDTYYHWAELERNMAEMLMDKEHDSADVRDQWVRCEKIAKEGIARCGISRPLCYLAGYSAVREARIAEHLSKFAYAQGAYSRAKDWFQNALTAPVSEIAGIGRGSIFRGLVLAYEGLEDEDLLQRTLKSWHASSESARAFETEYRRLIWKFPSLETVPELSYLRVRM